MLSELLLQISTAAHRLYKRIGNLTLRNLHLLDAVKELNKLFLSLQCLGVTALDNVVSVERDEETALFLVCATNTFTRNKML